MRRWNGWGDDSIIDHVPESAIPWLAEKIGPMRAPRDVTLEDVVRAVPERRLPAHPLFIVDAEQRVRHARGQSLPDWVSMRCGRIGRFPEGIAYPESEGDIRELFSYAQENKLALIPYGGGTSVVGHINPEGDGPPSLTVDMSRMSALTHLDTRSHLATFGAGIRGPFLEAALRAHGYTLGHSPQSFELSTLGGWIATRSSGQQSLYYGRIEHHFAGGRLVTPIGTLSMNPYPASAAGPDLRELVLGSEGRMGIISQATVRVHRLPEHEEFHAIFFPTWEAGVEAVRTMVQARLPLSMLRLSNPAETEANMVLAGHERLVSIAHAGLNLIGQRRDQKCLLLFGATGNRASVRQGRRGAVAIARRYGGFQTGQYMGKVWEKSRYRTPYLRNTLWEMGCAIDTLETIVPWADVLPTAQAITQAISSALNDTDERVFVFAHLSHLYPTGASIYVTYLFRVLPDPDQQIEYWQRMKHAASQAVVAHSGSISHQHGVGIDHAPYLEAEKGRLGMEVIAGVMRQCDPDGILNPGKLIRGGMRHEGMKLEP